MLQQMYNEWPFFRVTMDLVEMVFAKGDPGITALYDKLLVSEELWPFGELLRASYEETKNHLLQVKIWVSFGCWPRKIILHICMSEIQVVGDSLNHNMQLLLPLPRT